MSSQVSNFVFFGARLQSKSVSLNNLTVGGLSGPLFGTLGCSFCGTLGSDFVFWGARLQTKSVSLNNLTVGGLSGHSKSDNVTC